MPLSAPVTAVAVERSCGFLGRGAVASMQGVRANWEDTHSLNQELGFCAVYDGHLGDEASAFCAERLHLHLRLSVGQAGCEDASPEKLRRCFQACDSEMRAHFRDGSEAGSTATAAVVRELPDSHGALSIRVANLGDSRALLWKKESGQLEATRDHRPSDPEERKRIEAAGGTVSEEFDPPRVDGQLACSRAIGAYKFKKDDSLTPGEQKVSSVPDIYEWRAARGDWLIIGCDGVWDTLSSEHVVDEVCKAKNNSDLGATLAAVLSTCVRKECDDNMTLLAVELGSRSSNEAAVAAVTIDSVGDFLKTKDKEVLQQYAAFCNRFGFQLTKEMKPKVPPAASLVAVAQVPGPRFAHLDPPPAFDAPSAHRFGLRKSDTKSLDAIDGGIETGFARKKICSEDQIIDEGEDEEEEKEEQEQAKGVAAKIQQVKISSSRNVGFYVRTAKGFFQGTDETPGCRELEVVALGSAISSAASIAAALESEGHRIIRLETNLMETIGSNHRGGQTHPRLSIVVERGDVSARGAAVKWTCT